MYNQWTSQRHQRMTQTKSALESMNIPRTLIQHLGKQRMQIWLVAAYSVTDQYSDSLHCF